MLTDIIYLLAAADQAARDQFLPETERKRQVLLAAALTNYLIKVHHIPILEIIALVEIAQRGDLAPADD